MFNKSRPAATANNLLSKPISTEDFYAIRDRARSDFMAVVSLSGDDIEEALPGRGAQQNSDEMNPVDEYLLVLFIRDFCQNMRRGNTIRIADMLKDPERIVRDAEDQAAQQMVQRDPNVFAEGRAARPRFNGGAARLAAICVFAFRHCFRDARWRAFFDVLPAAAQENAIDDWIGYAILAFTERGLPICDRGTVAYAHAMAGDAADLAVWLKGALQQVFPNDATLQVHRQDNVPVDAIAAGQRKIAQVKPEKRAWFGPKNPVDAMPESPAKRALRLRERLASKAQPRGLPPAALHAYLDAVEQLGLRLEVNGRINLHEIELSVISKSGFCVAAAAARTWTCQAFTDCMADDEFRDLFARTLPVEQRQHAIMQWSSLCQLWAVETTGADPNYVWLMLLANGNQELVDVLADMLEVPRPLHIASDSVSLLDSGVDARSAIAAE